MEELTIQQKDSLQKFRSAVSDIIKPAHHDVFLLNWLRARNFDPIKAEKMYRETIRWRTEFGVENISDTWKCPEVLEKYLPYGIVGYSKESNPVITLLYGNMDIRGLQRSTIKEQVILKMIAVVERIQMDLAKMTEKLGRYIHQVIIIVDYEGGAIRDTLNIEAISILQCFATLYEKHYPELLKNLYIINVPVLITLIYNLVKPFINEVTQNKIKFFDSDRSKWIPALLEVIDSDQLPKHWGGTMVDPDGNPKCPSKIVPGRKIPQSYYISNRRTISDKCLESATIKRADSLRLHFDVKDENSHLRWAFQTDDYDVGFMVHRICSDRKQEVVPYARINSNVSLIEGQTETLDPGKYIVTFDNSYSRMRSKSLYYWIEVIHFPTEVADIQLK